MSFRALFLILALCVAIAPLAAHGGGDSGGGGGKGVLCHGKLRTLDIYEAEEVYHLHIPKEPIDEQSALTADWQKLIEYFKNDDSHFSLLWNVNPDKSRTPYWDQLDSAVDKRMVDIPQGTHLPLSRDTTVPKLLPGCKFVQILELDIPHLGSFDHDWQGKDVRIKRDLQYWNMLDARNKAALRLHELLYSVQGIKNEARPEANSDDVRRLIGLMASDRTPTPMGTVIGVPKKRQYSCRNGHHVTPAITDLPCRASPEDTNRSAKTQVKQMAQSFKVVEETRNGQAGLGIYFNVINGISNVIETSAFIPGITLKQFDSDVHQRKKTQITAVAKSLLTKETYNVELHFGYGAADFPYMTPDDEKWFNPISIRAWRVGEAPSKFSAGECESFLDEDVDPYPSSCRQGDVNEPTPASSSIRNAERDEEDKSLKAGAQDQVVAPAE